ncbi:coniferyl aldehyde dehydrogenase [Stutzerimonas frequens]|uniref:Aldehyde dehydrogenase n=1 Tax=Stutzerimonas frequens TaxID=2968969 RepID=A0AA47E235_9GAMM|nr:coniferyl aldehyde dehydrogenase [Stutzerimonas frequens]WAE51477.1 coniferyl aldehyde dehydrogenase [Stutzerimonas frequens]
MTTLSQHGLGIAPSEILARQRAAFLKEGPPSLAQRKADLRKLKSAILARREEIQNALIADFGHRSPHETAIMEVMTVIQAINYQRCNLRRWMRPEKRQVPMHFQPGRAWVNYQPLGVIGVMSPWNYPLSLALMPLATALAAGNRVMIKPSEFTPTSSALLHRLAGEVFGPEQVAVVMGDAGVGQAFSALPFDHLLFTGSTEVGRSVMKAASENLVPVTLELGGKSPVIIEPGHCIGHAATSIAHGKLANAGQICIAPDYVLVHQDALDDFIGAFDRAVRRLYPEGPLSDQYTSVINERHYDRLNALLDDAREKGARIVEVGERSADAGRRAHTLAPTVVVGTNERMRIMQEEIFGPVLPVLPYRDIDQAIAYINGRPRPLALYFFGGNGPNRRKVLELTTSGNVTINNTLMHYAQEDLPFGGVGPSGMGAYHGIEGFKALSHARGVFQQGKWNLSGMLRPPFGGIARLILALMLR